MLNDSQCAFLRGSRALIAEDEPWIREYLRGRLAMHGCVTVGVDTVEAARTQVRSNSFEVVVVDLRLRDGHAEPLLESLLDASRPMPSIIVITGSLDPRELQQWQRAGATVVLKPFDVDAFASIVADSLRFYRDRLATLALAYERALSLVPAGQLPNDPPILDLLGRPVGWEEIRERYLTLVGVDEGVVSEGCFDCLRMALAGEPLSKIGTRLVPQIGVEAVKKRLARLRRRANAESLKALANLLGVSEP